MKPRNNENKMISETAVEAADTAADDVKETEVKDDKPDVEQVIREVRHTITAEETFTLAKDVFDLRCLVKSVYSNRAQIIRRLNIFSTVLSAIFTFLYVMFMAFSGVMKIASYASQVVAYSIIGVHVALTIALIIVSLVWGSNATTQNVKRKNQVLRIFRFVVRVASLAMGISAVVMSMVSGTDDVISVALDTVALIISIVFVIFSLLPLIFGGFAGLARWLMSPTKVKLTFSFVVLEWYQLLLSENATSKTIQRVSKTYMEDISRCVDGYLIPVLGKRKITSVNANHIYLVVDRAPQEDRHVVEGILKNVFGYALECGYVVVDPCRAMNLEGSIEVEKKKAKKAKKPTLKQRITKKVGKGIINSIFGEDN